VSFLLAYGVDRTLSEILKLADACVIMERGKSVWQGRPEAITGEIEQRYLGL